MRSIAPNTRTKSPQRKLQEGQAIVLIALLMLVLFAMLGLAIDSGRAYVDRRDLQSAVDAAALAAGDWYENYPDLTPHSIPNAVQVFQNDLRIYAPVSTPLPAHSVIGPNANLPKDVYSYSFYSGSLLLTVTAINTQFNGYQFTFDVQHWLPLAFMQIFGGPATAYITATATSIVGNQRQTPAILTLNPTGCSLTMKGGSKLTVLGDVYANGQACVDINLNEAGNCYGAAGSTCSAASYWCYNSTPGFIPYDPNGSGPPVHPVGSCATGDTIGAPVVPAPSLPDPNYLAPSIGFYNSPQSFNLDNRGTYTEMLPGSYGTFHLSGASPAKCAFLDAGIYQWTGGYTSDATGSLLSNELKAPNEELYSAVGTQTTASPQFWNLNGAGCAGSFTLAVTTAAGYGIKKGGLGIGSWGVELTSVRYDQFLDSSSAFSPNPCLAGCRRESAPSGCQQVPTLDIKDQVIDVSITQNAPGAEYYNVYVNPNGCLPCVPVTACPVGTDAAGTANDFSFIGSFNAPGFSGGVPVGPYPNGGAGTIITGGTGGWVCSAAGHTICAVTAGTLLPNTLCFAQARYKNCQPPDDEYPPQCFSNCVPPPTTLSQENAPMNLEYFPFTGGDVANENYCQTSPASGGDPNAPCATANFTPGAVQFYFPGGSCMTQNAQGATYVFSGKQYNWIVIYQQPVYPVPPISCSNTLDGGAATQYIGTIYTPTADWKITGGARSPLAGQVIAWTATVAGGAAVGVDFNPNYAPAPPAARLIN
jgi:Flp pilus assembly protein TadG